MNLIKNSPHCVAETFYAHTDELIDSNVGTNVGLNVRSIM